VGDDTFLIRKNQDGDPEISVSIPVQNTGEVTFTAIEYRVDVLYDQPARDVVNAGVGYVVGEFDGFGPGSSTTLTETFELDDTVVDGTEPDDRYDTELSYRRVEYRATG
jgi:hypothetical protein